MVPYFLLNPEIAGSINYVTLFDDLPVFCIDQVKHGGKNLEPAPKQWLQRTQHSDIYM